VLFGRLGAERVEVLGVIGDAENTGRASVELPERAGLDRELNLLVREDDALVGGWLAVLADG
jgi:hypothetical protein